MKNPPAGTGRPFSIFEHEPFRSHAGRTPEGRKVRPINPCFVHRHRHRLSACGAIWQIVRSERIKQKILVGLPSSHGSAPMVARNKKATRARHRAALYATASFPVPPLPLTTGPRREGSAPQRKKPASEPAGSCSSSTSVGHVAAFPGRKHRARSADLLAERRWAGPERG
jgi:hypothetical protein